MSVKKREEKPVCILTLKEAEDFMRIDETIKAASEALQEAYKQRQHLWRILCEAYKISQSGGLHLNSKTGEVFKTWEV